MRSVIPLSLFTSFALAQSLLTPISYKSTLESYYYFRNGAGGIQVSNEGITITGNFKNTAEICNTLDGAQIVYFADDADGTLLTSNCWDVYYMATPEQKLLSWSSCEEFPFFESVCGSLSSSASGSTSGSTNTSGSTVTFASTASSATQHTTTYQSDTAVVDDPTYKVVGGSLSTVTTTLNGVVTTYTTYCPITAAASTTVVTITSCSENKCSEVPVTTGISLVTKVVDNVLTTYTTYCPLTALTPSVPSSVTSATSVSTEVKSATSIAAEGATSTTTIIAKVASSTTNGKDTVIGSTTVTGKTAVTGETTKSSTELSTLVAATSTRTRSNLTTAAISTFEGAAIKLSTFSAGLALAAAALLF